MTYVNEQNVREFTSKHPKAMIMIGASWCMPCRVMKPKVINMEADYDSVSFAYLDIDEGQEWAKQHNVMAVPTFIIYLDGKLVRAMPTSNEMGVRELLGVLGKV